MIQRAEKTSTVFLALTVLEGLIVIFVLLAIPADPKNAILLGYSKSRLLLLAVAFLLVAFFSIILFNKGHRLRFARLLASSPGAARISPWVGGAMLLLLWLLLWTPPYRFEEGEALFTRLQPLLVWIALIGVQFSFAALLIQNKTSFKNMFGELNGSRRWLFIGAGIFLLTTLVFFGLRFFSRNFSGNLLFFPPGAPFSALQVIVGWLAFFALLLLENKTGVKQPARRLYTLLIFLFIWLLTFALWSSVPFPCTDDRPGPYPPNNACYPAVNDAVYSIGSHYITLGQGVYNRWLTDKPLYMAFLALAQTITSPFIDDYLGFQIAVIALLPSLLFLAGMKKYGNAFGVFLALMTAVQGAYAIALYREVGSVHVKLENPEVLTALLLVLLSITAFKWLTKPASPNWGILSGGVLGAAALLRFNPIFIAPFLLIAVFLAGRKNIKTVISPVLLFILAFALLFSPWFLSATDKNGRNHYLAKIEEVLESRFIFRAGNEPSQNRTETGGNLTDSDISDSPAGKVLNYNLPDIDRIGPSGIFYHFMNNVYTGLAKLPSTLVLHPVRAQVKEGIWTLGEGQPIWQANLRVENLLALAINLGLVLTGIITAWKRYGIAGLSGVLIQAGYYAGNAFSQTSGGRYLEAVFWILIVYYCLGLYTITTVMIKAFSEKASGDSITPPESSMPVSAAHGWPRKWLNPALLTGFLAIGLVLPALNLISPRLPDENDPTTTASAFDVLSQHGIITNNEWDAFLQDPAHVIIRGKAYHPRYYRSSFYRRGSLSFELMLLAKDNVYIGYSRNIRPDAPFSDRSDVILVGCQLGRDTLWNARRVIVESIAIIQLDNESNILINEESDWVCSR